MLDGQRLASFCVLAFPNLRPNFWHNRNSPQHLNSRNGPPTVVDRSLGQTLLFTSPPSIRSRLADARRICRALDREILAEVSALARIRLDLSMRPHNPSYFTSLVRRDRFAQRKMESEQDIRAAYEVGKWKKGSLLRETTLRNQGSFYVTNDALWIVEPLSTAIRLCTLLLRSSVASVHSQLLGLRKPHLSQRSEELHKTIEELCRLEDQIHCLQIDLTALRHYRIRNFPQGVREQEITQGRNIYTWLGWRSSVRKKPRCEGLLFNIRYVRMGSGSEKMDDIGTTSHRENGTTYEQNASI